MHRRIALALAATLIAAPLAALPTTAAQADEPVDDPILSLRVPSRTVAYAYGSRGRVRVPLAAGLRAGADPFELWSTRPSYDEGIRTVWKSPGGDVELPAGSMTTFAGLNRFLKVSVKNVATGKVETKWKNVCLNSYEAHRSRPDAPATNPYPYDCPYNSYTLGSVQGIERGWTSNVLGWQNPLRLDRGKYDVTIEVAPKFAAALGLDPADVKGTTRVIVKKGGGGEEGRPTSTEPRPRSKAPTGPTTSDADALEGPVPNLKSLPAWGIGISHNGNNLTFAATVWNAGNSPLVVDGFRRRARTRWTPTSTSSTPTATRPATDGRHHGVGRQADPPALALQRLRQLHAADAGQDRGRGRRRRRSAWPTPTPSTPPSRTPTGARRTPTSAPPAVRRTPSRSARCSTPAAATPTRSSAPASRSDLTACRTASTTSRSRPTRTAASSSVHRDNVALRKIILAGKPGHRKVRVPQIGIIEEDGNIFDD